MGETQWNDDWLINSIEVMYQMVIKGLNIKTRLSDIPVDSIPFIYSKSQWKKYIKSQKVLLNDHLSDTGTWVENGDTLKINESHIPEGKAYKMELDMVYEDDDIFVVNKPSGIIVSGNKHRTLENALHYHYSRLQKEVGFRSRFIHRLDSQTSGLIIGVKSHQAMIHLQDQLKRHLIIKEYIALLEGKTPLEAKISLPTQGKSATTFIERFRIIQSNKYGPLSLIKVHIKEGRTHQIRIHSNSIGHPVMGDKIYNNGLTKQVKGLFLHASRLKFIHPISEEQMIIKSNLPERFKKFGVNPEDLPHF